MLKSLLLALSCWYLISCSVCAQNIYYKNADARVISQFSDSLNKFSFVNNDSSIYRNYFNYVLKYFPAIRYGSVEVIFKPGKKAASSKPGFLNMFRGPEKRKYRIYLSNNCHSLLDSVTLGNLRSNSRLGLIARQIGHIYEYSTDGFFDLLAWHLKFSRRTKKKLEQDIEHNLLEVGLGYQLLSLSKDEEQKLQIEKWKDAKAYAWYVKHEKNKHLSPELIQHFIKDMPVYVSHSYK